MDNPDEGNSNTSWVFDSLIGFLHGPVWNIPLQTFIEEKSLPFEPSMSGDVVDQPEYKKIHDEYKNLVDVMLGSFMDDIGITAEQFEAACRMSARNIAGLPPQFHRRLFEQIWAANDYDIFVKMMTHKNVELQLQALELIERRFGAMPHIFIFNRPPMEESVLDSSRSDGDGDSSDSPDEDDVMVELKKLQIKEIDEDIVEVPPEDVMAEKQTLLSKLHKFGNKDIAKKFIKPAAPLAPAISAEVTPQPIELPKPPPPPPPKKAEVSEEEIRNRQEYLKQQRDKLLAMKKEVREKRLGAAVTGNDTPEGGDGGSKKWIRPKSAHVAKAAMAGAPPAPPPDAMQMRRALATKLKTEVVDTN